MWSIPKRCKVRKLRDQDAGFAHALLGEAWMDRLLHRLRASSCPCAASGACLPS